MSVSITTSNPNPNPADHNRNNDSPGTCLASQVIVGNEKQSENLKHKFSENNVLRIFDLKKEICDLRQGELSVTAYFIKLKTLWEEYNNYRCIPHCTNGVNCPVLRMMIESREKDYTMQFLMGLNDEIYANLKIQILLVDSLPAIDQVFALVVHEEKQRVMPLSVIAETIDFVYKSENDTKVMEKKEEEENQIVCVSVFFEDFTRHWFAIDPRVGSLVATGREITEMRKNWIYSQLDKNVSCDTVVLDSKIYYLGGSLENKVDCFSNKCCIFDMITGCWSEGPPLNQPRCLATFSGAIGREIYVFGTQFGPRWYREMSEENWGECYDLDSQLQQWEPISAPTHIRPDFLSCVTDAAVVYEDEILFWSRKIGIYSYNHRDKSWKFITNGFVNGGPKPCFNFNCNHVVIGDFAVWQYYGSVYAWDLTNHHSFFIWTLPGQWFHPPQDDMPPNPGRSKLVHVGNGMLCFLRWQLYKKRPNICSYRFKIKGSKQSCGETCQLEIGAIGRQFSDVPGIGCGIHDAFALSASCFGGAYKD